SYVFESCAQLKTIMIEDGCTAKIDGYAFEKCSKLEKVQIPKEVEDISISILYESPKAVIWCYNNSYALNYALDNKYDYHIIDEGESEYPRGDVNGDGVINVTDITKVAAHVKGKKLLDAAAQKRADVNNDGKINVSDISKIAAHVKGKKLLS
ncbi:dockerin type I domain-containing protein, partial [Ruminococcus albus]